MKTRKVTVDDCRAIIPEIRDIRNKNPWNTYEDTIQMLLCRRTSSDFFNPPEDVIKAAANLAKILYKRDEAEKIMKILKGE